MEAERREEEGVCYDAGSRRYEMEMESGREGSVFASTSGSEVECVESEMDGGLWSRLPKELLLSILPFLPWQEVFRLRMICREWNSILRSESYGRSWRRDPQQVPLCFTGGVDTRPGNTIFNPVTKKWLACGNAFLPLQSMEFKKHVRMSTGHWDRPLAVVGAAEGLLLLRMKHLRESEVSDSDDEDYSDAGKFDLYVVNPLHPWTIKTVPLLPHLQCTVLNRVIGIVWNNVSSSHEIIILHDPPVTYLDQDYMEEDEDEGRIFYSYDLKADEWKVKCKWPEDKFRRFQSPSMGGGRFCCLGGIPDSQIGYPGTPSLYLGQENPTCFHIYSLSTADPNSYLKELGSPFRPSWSNSVCGHPNVTQVSHFATLFHENAGKLGGGDRVTVAGGVVACSHAQSPILKCFCVWRGELFMEEKKAGEMRDEFESCEEEAEDVSDWKEIIRMPDHVRKTLNERNVHYLFRCATNGRYVCVANTRNDVVFCNVETETWWTLPPYPSHDFSVPVHPEPEHDFDLQLLEPRLDIIL